MENHAPVPALLIIMRSVGSYNVTMYNTSAYGCKSKPVTQAVYVSPIPNAICFSQTSVCILMQMYHLLIIPPLQMATKMPYLFVGYRRPNKRYIKFIGYAKTLYPIIIPGLARTQLLLQLQAELAV